MADSKLITDEPEMTPEDWAGILENDEPSDEEMTRSNEIDSRYDIDPDAEKEKELLD
jgi:hypothetical protein